MKTSLPKPMLDRTLDRANSDVVLIVDDVPDNLAVLHDALDESGYTVLVATNGQAALQRAAQVLPDIILLDAMMPGMDGFEVARQLKAMPKTAHIPIVFMTGLTETEYLVAALESGGVDYVTKPIKPKEVLARMAVHLQGAREKRQARSALDAFGYASITVRVSDGRLMWGVHVADGVGRGDATEVKRVIDDGHEKIGGGNQRLLVIELVDRRVVSSFNAHQQFRRHWHGAGAFQNIRQHTRGNLAATAATVRQAGQARLHRCCQRGCNW